MTNIADCIQRGIDFGEIDRQIGIEIIREFDQLVARYQTAMPLAQARARAAADLKAANKAKTARLRHVRLNQLQAMARLRQTILTAKDPAAAIKGLLEYNPLAGSKAESVRSLTEAYVSSINAAIRETLEKTGTNVVGNSRNARLLQNLIRELHDEATGDALAKSLAATVRKEQQRMRRAYNSYGGDIGDLADFGVTHAHDAGQMRLKGFEAWSTRITPLLAWDRIINLATGKPFAAKGDVPDPADVQTFLKDVYDGILTRGWDDRDPSHRGRSFRRRSSSQRGPGTGQREQYAARPGDLGHPDAVLPVGHLHQQRHVVHHPDGPHRQQHRGGLDRRPHPRLRCQGRRGPRFRRHAEDGKPVRPDKRSPS